MYGIGSTSKMFATAAAMTLADKGLLDIDKPLIDYIPEFKMADERYKQITPRMLMNHSSGIYGTSFADSFLFNDPSMENHDTLLPKLASQRLRAAPGEICEYCNDGFTLLEILVEHISGMSYTEFLAGTFCKPLGLTRTKSPQDDFDRAQLVKVYLPLYDGSLPVDTLNVIGSGGLYSTAEDLCRFSEVFMGYKPEILSENSALLMRNEEYSNGIWPEDNGESLLGYGLGWDNVHAFPFGDYGIQVAVKGGDSQMFHSSLVTIPEYNIAMAVVSSGGASAFDGLFASSVLEELLLEKGLIKEISPQRTFEAPVAADMPEELAEYSGMYANADSQVRVTVKGGMLTLDASDVELEYIYVGDGAFSSSDGSETLKFIKAADGNIYIQSKRFPVLPGVGQAAICAFNYQKIEPVTVPETLLDSWKARVGMKYYMVSERPTSQAYFMDPTILCMQLSNDFENGYAFAGSKITEADLAVNTLTFRDVKDLVFRMHGGVEYLKTNDLEYIREDFIPELTAAGNECVIDEDNFAKYYSIGTDVAGKTMTVNIPEGAAYAVYDENDVCVDFSTVSYNNITVLPTNGKVAFIGSAGDVFKIELK